MNRLNATSALLHNRRIQITSPEPMAGRLTRRLAALGAEPVHIPLIAIQEAENLRPLDRSLAALPRYDWVVFTSSNGVRSFFKRARTLGIDDQVLSAPRYGAVGSQSAAQIEKFGWTVAFVPSRFTGADLAREIPLLPAQRFLLPASDIAGDTLAAGIEDRDGLVTRVAAYRTVPCVLSSEELADVSRGVDAILFSSGSAATVFAAISADTTDFGPAIGSIGPTTTAALCSHGLDVDFEADESTAHGLCLALDRHFSNVLRQRRKRSSVTA